MSQNENNEERKDEPIPSPFWQPRKMIEISFVAKEIKSEVANSNVVENVVTELQKEFIKNKEQSLKQGFEAGFKEGVKYKTEKNHNFWVIFLIINLSIFFLNIILKLWE